LFNTISNLRRPPRLPRLARYSPARIADIFAATAELIGSLIDPSPPSVGVSHRNRRIETFLRYYDGFGAIIVQLNVEDNRNGVAEYVVDKYGDKVTIELKWRQGAKDIGGEIQVTSYGYAKFLKDRGYIVDPDPNQPGVKEAFDRNVIRSFARHSRLGYTNLSSVAEVQADFMNAVEYLRGLGYPRVTLKTGSYGMEELAMAIRFATDAGLDLLTIDGSGGGTGMSPWNMMETWGVPSLLLPRSPTSPTVRLPSGRSVTSWRRVCSS